MVGVTGRSKTCKTCKRRRIACSLERPSCNTCTRASRVCEGYQDAPIFILDKRSKPPSPKSGQLVRVSKSNFVSDIVHATNTDKGKKRLEATICTKEAYKSLWQLSSPHTRAAYRDQILSEFLVNYPQTPTEPRAGSWLALLPNHPTYTTALEASILAICTAKLGRTHRDNNLVKESLRFYIQGLWELQKALWDDKLMYRDETLAACMCLIIYEVAECPDQSVKGWTRHLKGCAKLFQLRGPKSYQSEMAHCLFLTFRQIEIQQAIAEHRSTFLSQSEWLSHPWKGRQKHISQQLLDLMAEVAGLIEGSYQTIGNLELQARPDLLLLAIMSIVDQSWKLDVKLRAFYRRLEKSTAGPIFWSTLYTGPLKIEESTRDFKVFPVAYVFPSMATAHACMVFWATTSILWSGQKALYSLLAAYKAQLDGFLSHGHEVPNIGFSLNDLPTLENREDVSVLAKNICQSVDFCKNAGPMTAVSAVFPLKVAIEILGADSSLEKELAWAEDAMEKIRTGTGVRILGHLGGKLTDRAFIPG
ncbi:hypothetical protein VTL71DRAFT_6938 [Oculimacula yallundae]|uniref:Zn(2)-C6 fungal-type domain-containing protein n=1 Tax=Oculimacula yallundae TaxID=86028 RepID=A0ABR4BWR3_9HELO